LTQAEFIRHFLPLLLFHFILYSVVDLM